MISHKNHNLNVDEDYVMVLTSKLVLHFINGFTPRMTSQSLAYLLLGSAHMYWISNLKGEVQSIWDL